MSLKQIAEMVGTSVSTVSRVLNQTSPTCASGELQNKIWAAARETGYRPNEAARKLRKADYGDARAFHISIVLARIASLEEEPFFAELFRDLEAELFKQNVTVDGVVYTKESVSQDLSRSDGVVILGRCSHQLLKRIVSQNSNIVGIWRNPTDFDVDEVVCDGKKAAELAMQYLLSLGHQRIAYIGDCSFESRYVGYCDMLIRSNLPMDYRLIKQTDQSRAQAETAFRELLRQRMEGEIDFSAVFCANDNTAVKVLEILRKSKKILHKEQISVISIDDIEEAQSTEPYLTTIHIPRREMAHMAVLLLLDRMAKGHVEIVRNEFPCRITQRSSCYPAKAADA